MSLKRKIISCVISLTAAFSLFCGIAAGVSADNTAFVSNKYTYRSSDPDLDGLPINDIEDDIFIDVSDDEAEAIDYEYENSAVYSASLKADNKYVRGGRKYYSDTVYNVLNTAEKTFYDGLRNVCNAALVSTLDYTEPTNLSGTDYYLIGKVSYSGLTIDRAKVIMKLFKFSNPQFFFISQTTGKNSKNQLFYPIFSTYCGYNFNYYSVRKNAQDKLDALTNEWMTEINEAHGDLEKELIICDKVRDFLTYDYNAIDTNYPGQKELLHFDQSIISGVLRKTTVCAGYAMMGAYFFNAAGLDSFYVNGPDHAWNIVKIFDNYYETDLTWYDSKQNDKWINKSHATFLAQDKNGHHVYRAAYWSGITLPDCGNDSVIVPDPAYAADSSGVLTQYIGYGGDIVIPSEINGRKITALGDSSFRDNRAILTAVVPDDITSIGTSAFSGCIRLKKLTLPEDLTYIAENAFAGCSGLSTIVFGGTVDEWKALTDNKPTGITLQTSIKCSDGQIDFRPAKSITILTKPVKTTYYQGDELDLTGGKISVSYADGTVGTVDITDSMISGFDPQKTGIQSVKVTYREQSCSFTVTVNRIKAISIEIESLPTKTSYFLNDKLELEGGSITVTYNNGNIDTLDMTDEAFTVDSKAFNPSKAGTYTITIKLEGQSVSFTVDVSVDPEKANLCLELGENKWYYNTLADAFAKMTAQNDTAAVYILTVRNNITERSLTFPKSAKCITLKTNAGAALTLSSPGITANCDIVLDCTVETSDARAKTLTIKPAANKKVTINRLDTALPLTVSGTKTNDLIIGADVEIVSASAVNTEIKAGAAVTVDNGKFAPTKLSGDGSLNVKNASAVTITEAAKADITLYQYADRTGKTLLPKLTVTEAADLTITVMTAGGETADISGQTILSLAKQDTFSGIENKIKFVNTDGENTLSAVQYKKDVRAEYLRALTLNDGKDDLWFPSFEKLFDKINEDAKPRNAVPKAYTVTMNTDMAAEKFALPAKAAGISFDGSGHTLKLTGVTSIAPKYAFSITDIDIVAADRSGKPAALSINNTSGALSLENITFGGRSLTISSTKEATAVSAVTVGDDVPLIIKGGTKNTLTVSGCPVVNALSGFEEVTVIGKMKIEKTLSTGTLDLGNTGELVTGSDPAARTFTPAAITVRKLLRANGGSITLTNGFKPITISAAAEGTIALVSENIIDDNVQILNSMKCDLSAFDVSGIKGGSTEYALTRTQSKVFCRKTQLSMGAKRFVTFADVVSAIEAANRPADNYEITLLDNYYNGAALKFPKAGTYGKISVSTGTKTFTFTGNVTLTGNTAISGTFYAVDIRKNTPVKYTIATARDKALTVSAADLGMVTSIGLASSDITLSDVSFTEACKITAKQLTFSGITGIIDTLTVNTIKAVGTQEIMLLAGKPHKVNTAQDAASGWINLLMVNADGTQASLKNNAVIFTLFKGDKFDIGIINRNVLRIIRDSRSKVTVTV